MMFQRCALGTSFGFLDVVIRLLTPLLALQFCIRGGAESLDGFAKAHVAARRALGPLRRCHTGHGISHAEKVGLQVVADMDRSDALAQIFKS